MQFKAFTLDDIDTVEKYIRTVRSSTCDYTVGGIFLWRDFFKMEFAIENDVFYSRLRDLDGKLYYNIPLSENGYTAIRDFTLSELDNNASVDYFTVPEEYLPAFDGIEAEISVTEQRDYFDYVYSAELLASFAGKKLKGQRNQVSQFLRSNDSWDFKNIDEENIADVLSFYNTLPKPSENDPPSKRAETEIVKEILLNFRKYRAFGGILYANGSIVGFSIGEKQGNTIFNHIEKADRTVKGAYQMLVNQFAKKFGTDVDFINREDDTGDLGLRKAKEAYHPVKLEKKYIVSVKALR